MIINNIKLWREVILILTKVYGTDNIFGGLPIILDIK